MSARSIAMRMAHRVPFWIAAGFALLLSHDAVFLVQTGPGQPLVAALRNAGHAYWGMASVLLVATATLGMAIWTARIVALRCIADRTPAGRALAVRHSAGPADTWWRRAFVLWMRLFPFVVVLFVLQENAEHVLAHGHAIGLGALIGPEYPLAIPILALVTGLAAAVVALLRQHEVELRQRIEAARALQLRPRRVAGLGRPSRTARRHPSLISVHRALRAPPLAFLRTQR